MSTRYGLKGKTITIGTTASDLRTLTGAQFASSVSFRTPAGNSGTVYVGGPEVNSTTEGFGLPAGAQVTTGQLMANKSGEQFDLSQIFVVGSTGGQILYVLFDAPRTVAD